MGSNNSKSTSQKNYSDTLPVQNRDPLSSLPRTKFSLQSHKYETNAESCSCFSSKQRSCSKKKILILGLDGVGKTELFTRLICCDKRKLKIDSLPRPTIGYNVETIRISCQHLPRRRYYEITLWDCGGQPSVQSLWSYHYSQTSLLLWLINIHDRSRLDMNIDLLSAIIKDPNLSRVPVLIVLYNSLIHPYNEDKSLEEANQSLLTNLEISFRFLATLSTAHASTFKWQVINISSTEKNFDKDFKKLRQCFVDLMDL